MGESCPHCGAQLVAASNFCGQCGQRIGISAGGPSPAGSLATAPPARSIPMAERRPLTVMFCDLVGSTAMSQSLDPEDWRELLMAYQSTCSKAIEQFQGYIAQYLGDGLLIYFGFPVAHEDSCRRAVLAGLSILRAIRANEEKWLSLANSNISVRIGIHYGLVVVSEIGAGPVRELAAQGAVPNVAARIQGLAEPGAVVISADAHKLVDGFFDCRDLGRHLLKGLDEPMEVFQVLGEAEAKTRLDVLTPKGLMKMVGREDEFRVLHEAWQKTKQGAGGIVQIVGEAGIGKSRLTKELQTLVANEGATVLVSQCSPYHQDSAFYPVVELFTKTLRFRREMSTDEQQSRIEQLLSARGLPLADSVPLLAAFLGIPVRGDYKPLLLSPERQRQRTAELIVEMVVREFTHRRGLFIVEDLHWADPSTLGLLQQVAAKLGSLQLLVLFTYRSEFELPWPATGSAILKLERLPAQAAEALVQQVISAKALSSSVLKQIIAKSDGNPLFLEEVTKAVLESPPLPKSFQPGDDNVKIEIPATLGESLMARLDRLPEVKPVAQICSIIGREFQFDMALELLGWPEQRLREALDRLMAAEIIFGVDSVLHTKFSFKHALIQNAAYESLLRKNRREYHRRIAETIPRKFAEIDAAQPGYVAEHWVAAGDHANAILYWLRAGLMALQKSANQEAISQTRKALAALEKLEPSESRDTMELSLLSVLGVGLIATQGFGAREVGQVYARASGLWRQLGSKPELCGALWGLWVFYLVRSELEESKHVAEELLSLGIQAKATSIQIEGHWTLGDSLFWLGELELSREHLELAIAMYEDPEHRRNAFLYGQDPRVAAYCYRSAALYFLGYPNAALQSVETSLDLARATDHPFSVAWALAFNTMLRVWVNDFERALQFADQTIAWSSEQVHPFWLFASLQFKGWTLVLTGQSEAGLKLLNDGFQGYQAIGSITVQPFFMGLQAAAFGLTGKLERGQELIKQAIDLAVRSNQRVLGSGLWRLQGDLTRMAHPSSPELAELCYLEALAKARAIRSPMIELQAQIQYSGLLHDWNRSGDALKQLETVYMAFPEKSDSFVRRDAEQLLKRLGSSLPPNS